ncbi:MAG: redoxin family protein [Myxococcota bacterium]
MSGRRPGLYLATAGLVAALALTACAGSLRGGGPRASDARRVEALLISGGGKPADNAYAHVVHLRGMLDVLRGAGLRRDRIAVLASDGADPAPDLARAVAPGHRLAWTLDGTRFDLMLRVPASLESTALDGIELLPANSGALEAWMHYRGRHLVAGDTLLVYVTDHGRKNPRDTSLNEIVLWGNERMAVPAFRALLDRLAPGVRVVLVMSQCYSGGFLDALVDGSGEVRPDSCAFFSTRPDRVAYGCYSNPPGDGLDGHGIGISRVLEPGLSVGTAHDRLTLGDVTPDVPHRGSVAWLARAVEARARRDRARGDMTADLILGESWAADPRYEGARAEIAALAEAFGLPTPASGREMGLLELKLTRAKVEAATAERAWQERARGLGRSAIARFTAADRRYAGQSLADLVREQPNLVAGMDGPEMRATVRDAMLGDLETWARGIPAEAKALAEAEAARAKYADAVALRYAMDVRLGVLERMRLVLLAAAGDVLATEDATLAQGAERLRACEEWPLPGRGSAVWAASPSPPAALGLEAALAQIEALRPPWQPKPKETLEVGGEIPDPSALQWYRGEAPKPGRTTLYFFWATWCGPCKAALPELMALAQAEDLDIVAVTQDTPSTLDRFFAGWQTPFPERIARDPQGDVHANFAAQSLPTFVVVDPDGRVISYARGMPREGGLRLRTQPATPAP